MKLTPFAPKFLLRQVLIFILILSAVIPVALVQPATTVYADKAGVCATPGADGSPVISGIVNSYFPGSANAVIGATSITLGTLDARGSATTINAGDLLLVIQMQGADIDTNNDARYGAGVGTPGDKFSPGSGDVNANFSAGQYEYVVAQNAVGAGGGTLNLTTGLVNNYFNANYATQGQRRFQVVRVPQYVSATLGGTLTAPAWNGATGGTVIVDVAGGLNLNGNTIDVTGLGFRGGAGIQMGGDNTAPIPNQLDFYSVVPAAIPNQTNSAGGATPAAAADTTNGAKGEGTAGTPRYVNVITAGIPSLANTGVEGYPSGSMGRGAPGNAGGGGTDGDPAANGFNSGGGGGGNGGAGGNGGKSYSQQVADGGWGGSVLGSAGTSAVAPSRLVLGGGGGAGSNNNGTYAYYNGTTVQNNPSAGAAAVALIGFQPALLSSGQPGGGIVMVRAGVVTGNGTINAKGRSGYRVTTSPGANANYEVNYDGGGGGGAGGSVVVVAQNASTPGLTVNAQGGDGGNTNHQGAGAPPPHGPGGGGGGGVVYTSFAIANPANAVNGGLNGLTRNTTPWDTAFNAFPGAAGVLSQSQSPASFPGSISGAGCLTPATLTKSFNPISIGLNGASTATFTITNTVGNPSQTGLAFTETLPANLTLAAVPVSPQCGGTVTGVVGGVAIGFTGGSLPAGTASCSITASVTGNVGGTYNNSPGNISNASTNLDTSSVNATLTVAAPSLTKTFTPTSIPTGGTSTLTFTITNGAGDPAQTGMQFTETLPLNVTLSAAPVSPQCGGTVTGVAGGTTIGFSSGILAAGVNTCTITATVTSATAATYNNLPANVTGSNLNTSGISASLTVTARAVTVTKAFNPTRIGVGQTSILTFTLSNLTAAAQNNNIQFTDTLPAGLTAAVTTPQCGAVVTVTNVAGTARAINFGNGVTNGSLAANATCTFTVTVTGVTAGTYNNTTALLSNVSANLEGSGITASLTVVGTTLTKSFSPASIGVGGTSTLTFTITNGAGLPAQAGLRFLETLPAGLTLSAVPVTPQCGGNVVGAVGGNTIQLGSVTGGSLALGEASCTISATVTGTGISTYLNTTANVTGVSTNITNNANASLTIAGTGLTKSFVPSTIPTGGTSTLTFTISNNGTGYPAQTGLRFTETLPANVTLSAVPVTPQCGGNVTGVVGGNTIQFGNVTGGSLSAGTASCTITATVTSATAGTYTNIAANISNLSNNVNATGIIATLTVLSPACASGQFSRWDFQNVITPSVGSGAFTAVNLTGPAYVLGATGQAVSYSNWPLAVATTDYVDFAVPTNGRGNITMTFDESRSAQGPTTFVVYYSTDGATYTQLGAAYTSATTWTNRVIDFSGVAGLNNNPNAHFRLYAYSANVVAGAWRLDNVTFTGNCIADLSVTKTDGVTTYTPGTSTTYTIVVANSGPTNITNATFTDTFPAAITAANWTCIGAGGATCPAASGSGNINATVTIPFGGSLTYTVTAAINSAATGNLINTATIAAPAGTLDPTAGNNSSTDTNTMLPIADLAVTKSDGVTSVKAGGTTTYTLTLTNNGPSAANSTTLRDAAAAGLTKIAIGACTVAGGAVCPTAGVGAGQMNIANLENGTVVVPTLPNGGSISFSVTVNVNAASGSVANIFTATPPVGTTDPTPATATDTNNVIEIIAADDTGSTVNGTTGGQSVANVLSNDSLNGTSPVLLADVNLTQVSTTNAGVTLNPADGSVNVAAGTPVGSYTVTYQICDTLNPTICDTATVSVPVGSIDAVNDTGATVNGTTGGQSLLNVLANDSLNGTSPVLLADVNLTQVSTTNAGVTLNPADGSVNVAAGTAAGSYTVTYQFCDKLNPTICDTATVGVSVGTIISVDDIGSTVNGTTGGQSLLNVLANDSLNGTSPVLLADVNLTQVATTNAGVTLNPADGSVNVAAGTPVGNYTVTYQICDKLNPTICDTATVGVSVGTIISVDDIGSTVNGTTGGQSLLNVLANDSLNGTSPVLLADVNLTQVSTTNAGVTLNPVDGSVNVAAGTAAGSYTVTYQICDILNPTICDTATVSVPVGTIIAVDDMGSTVNGTIGGQTLVNVLANDSLNGTSPVLLADVNLTQVSTTNAGVTLNPADGSVNVAAGTAAGSYTVTYQFCDKLNPTICDTATVGVPVSVDYADLALTKTVDNPSPNVGDNIIFIVTATNSGPSHATGVIVNDLLPAGLTYVSDNGGGTYVSATGNWTIGNLNSGASISLQITATVIQVGGITNTAQVISSDQLDPNSTNNQASASIGGIFDPPSAIKTINAAGLPELEFRMVWINSGNTLAIDVQVTDQIPTGTTYVAGSLTCVLLGSSLNAAAASSPLSVTAVPSSFCGYDSVANRIQWQGSMGPDNGNTTEAGAANEVVITFRVTVDGAVNQVQNQGFSRTDVDSDGNFDEETVLGASLVGSNVVVWNRSPSGPGNPGNGANLPRALPATGFAPNVVTTLPKQSAEKAYAATDVWLELPSLGVKVPIVGVPLVDNKWDLSWLGSQAGWLDGTAFPSWQGNSALTGHVTLSNGKSGPFANLGSLKWGDKIIVHAYGSAYTYEVRENKTIAPNDTSVLKHEDNAWLTLITCKTYSETKNTYANRISVRAVLLSVAEEGGGSRSARGR